MTPRRQRVITGAVTALDVEVVKVRLPQGQSVEEISRELGVPERTLRYAFTRATGLGPRAWRLVELGSQADPSPQVSFRLPEHGALVVAAEEAGKLPGEYAREVLQAHLRRRKKKR